MGVKPMKRYLKRVKKEYRMTRREWSRAVYHGQEKKARHLHGMMEDYRDTIRDIEEELSGP